mmetsp:Transcript_5066/g.8747  ORF Transcript_5066/g.8747 Transcript_5066/m.8747 type:complete len:235 (-) Transcript_5066:342-1046(-)
MGTIVPSLFIATGDDGTPLGEVRIYRDGTLRFDPTVTTLAPTDVPTSTPTTVPTSRPTSIPTSSPTSIPTSSPTPKPTRRPTPSPTTSPTFAPTSMPTESPTGKRTDLTFAYTICDDPSETSTATVTITLTSTPFVPEVSNEELPPHMFNAQDDHYVTTPTSAIVKNVLENDSTPANKLLFVSRVDGDEDGVFEVLPMGTIVPSTFIATGDDGTPQGRVEIYRNGTLHFDPTNI